MSGYFDHIKCGSCGARLDPENLQARPDGTPGCPYCKAELNMKDFFGVADHWVGLHDEEGNEHSLDDLVHGHGANDWWDEKRDGSVNRPPPQSTAQRQQPAQHRPPPRPAPSSPTASRPTPQHSSPRPSGPSAQNALIRRGGNSDEPSNDQDSPSAADILRQMKRRR